MYDDFNPDSYQTENQPPDFAAHRDAFLDAVLQTKVFKQAYSFLVDKGIPFFLLLLFAPAEKIVEIVKIVWKTMDQELMQYLSPLLFPTSTVSLRLEAPPP